MKADLHVHTDRSDGRDDIGALIQRAKQLRISALAVCDHNVCTPLPQESEVLLIPATEISTDRGHIVGLYVSNIDFAALTAGGLPTAEAAIAAIHAENGLAVLAHPFETGRYNEADYDGLAFDLVETANARAAMKIKTANARASRFAEKYSLAAVGGSDAHGADELGACLTEYEGDVEQALRQGRTRAVFLRSCTFRQKAKGRLRHAFRKGNVKAKIKAICFYIVAPLRDLQQR